MTKLEEVQIWLSNTIAKYNAEVAYSKCYAYIQGFQAGCDDTFLGLEVEKYWEVRKDELFRKMREDLEKRG